MYTLSKVGFCQANCNAIKNYANFSGRIRRSEYWYFVSVVNTLTVVFLSLFIFFISGGGGYYVEDYFYTNGYKYYYSSYHYNKEGAVVMLVLLSLHVGFIMIPLFAATVRRLHDTGRRGEYIFLGLVPFFGQITLLVILCMNSSKEKNEYGNSPKYTPMDINSPMALYNQNNNIYMNTNPKNMNPFPNNMNSNPNNMNSDINSNNIQPPSNYYAPVN